MVKRVKDPEDQEVVPVKWYQRRRCTDDTCAIASCCSGSREEITIVASVKDTEELPKPLKQIVKAKLQAKAVQAKRQANVKQNVKAAVPKLFKAPAKKYQPRREAIFQRPYSRGHTMEQGKSDGRTNAVRRIPT